MNRVGVMYGVARILVITFVTKTIISAIIMFYSTCPKQA